MRLSRAFRDQHIQHELRTFGRKNGYVTKGQEERLACWLPKIGLPRGATLARSGLDPSMPVVMEIGFGNGDFMVHLAKTHPEWNFVGVEIYLPGVAKAISRLEAVDALERVRISQLPAQFVLQEQIAAGQLHGVYINHPDPWPKTRHHKRRLIQKDFAHLLVSRLEPGGFIRLATDIPELAEWMRDILDGTPGLKNVAGCRGYVSRDPDRPQTKFEQRGINSGRKSKFLQYVKIKS